MVPVDADGPCSLTLRAGAVGNRPGRPSRRGLRRRSLCRPGCRRWPSGPALSVGPRVRGEAGAGRRYRGPRRKAAAGVVVRLPLFARPPHGGTMALPPSSARSRSARLRTTGARRPRSPPAKAPAQSRPRPTCTRKNTSHEAAPTSWTMAATPASSSTLAAHDSRVHLHLEAKGTELVKGRDGLPEVPVGTSDRPREWQPWRRPS